MTDRAADANDFIRAAGWGSARRKLLAGDASNRRYDRLTAGDGTSAVFMDAPADRGEDVRPFIRIARYLAEHGLSAPQILHQDEERGFLLIEDLGDEIFARLMAADAAQTAPLYAAATDVLIDLHRAEPLALPVCDAAWLTEATGPLFEWYVADALPVTPFNDLFHPLVQTLDTSPRVVILRDYHAENLLWLPQRKAGARVGLLDFQDALLGHPAYDLMSVLQDARRDVAPEIEAEMIARYMIATGVEPEAFHRAYALLGLQRNLRILGIFARLCLRDGKPHYLDFVPRVWGYIQRNLAHPDLATLAALLQDALPEPTAPFLEDMKSRCATHPTPS